MKLADLKPNQTLSLEEGKQIFEEISLSHAWMQDVITKKKKTLVHCRIQQVCVVENGVRVRPCEGKTIEFFVKSDRCL